jgi:site-specific recombinase XerD
MNTSGSAIATGYDRSLKVARHRRLPPDSPRPQPTTTWPVENIQLLARYHDWLLGSGASPYVVEHLYVPVAGHVLGLNLKPYTALDLDADLNRAFAYVQAKRLSAEWTKLNRNAVIKFRQFLQQQRGQRAVALPAPDLAYYQAGMPDWFIAQMTRYQHLRQAGWRPARLPVTIPQFWSHQTRLWRWLFAHTPVRELADLRRQHVLDYVDARLAAGYAPQGVNQDLRNLRAFLLFLQDQDWRIPQALLRLPGLKEPDRLPRFLTDEQMAVLRVAYDQHITQAGHSAQRRDALLDRAAFCLMWQAGLRLGEVEELRLADLDLAGRKLLVRQGKGRKDRAVFLADSAISALNAYLRVRGSGPTDHVFLYRAEPVHKDLLRCRVQAAGARAGVLATPHMLRHTYATQLLNAGCPVTSIQKLLGHRRLNSTLVYARVHDHTVADDYFAAMAQIEQRVAQAGGTTARPKATATEARRALLKLAGELAAPRLAGAKRLDLVKQLRRWVRCELRQPATP